MINKRTTRHRLSIKNMLMLPKAISPFSSDRKGNTLASVPILSTIVNVKVSIYISISISISIYLYLSTYLSIRGFSII